MWTEGYFTSKELTCKCGCGAGSERADVSDDLLVKLNSLREIIGPLTLSSGARCPQHNAEEGGKTHSAHLTVPGKLECRAVDIRVSSPEYKKRLIEGIKKVGFRRRGEANSFVHVDVGQAPEYPQDVVWFYH